MLFLQVILGLLMLATPFFIIFRYRLNILKKTVLALLKLSVMMILTAIFLQYLFEWNSVTANFMWILLMIGISAVGILRKARLQPMRFLIPIGIGVAVTSLLTGLYYVIFILGKNTPFDARYLIPVVGLLIGNMVENNGRALATYYSGLQYHAQLYTYLLGNGATHNEAVRYFVKRALEKSAVANLANMSVVVTGMSPVLLWSMLLGGTDILTAVVFQVTMSIVMLCTSMISLLITLRVARSYSFDSYERLRNVRPVVDTNQSV